MEIYLLKFSACLAVFWLVYMLFLERQNMHHFKRFYLLTVVILALIIPALTITHYVEPVVTDIEMSQMYIPIESSTVEMQQDQTPFLDLETILWMLYGFGVLLFTIRFAINLFKMYKRISNNETIAKHSFIYVLLEECRIPHSFFKYIFFNKSTYDAGNIPKEVQLHEETHAEQLHSLDIIIIELLQIAFWFHPLIYVLKHHIKLNHEFLADQAVLKKGSDTKAYQNILLQFSSPDSYRDNQDYHLSSAINYSSIKKRFTVMKTKTSKTRIWLSSLLLLPIIAILFYSFAEREYVEKEQIDPVAAIAKELQEANKLNMTYVDGATPAMMQEYNDWIKKLNSNSSSLFIPVGTWERLAAIYDIMNEEQRNSVETHPFLQETITPNLYAVNPIKPTPAQFESWKNEKEFAIWLDGKHISNSELNNYKINDITHYVGSKVHKNARSEKFPQPFQFNLYTKDGFKIIYQESAINSYNKISKIYSEAIGKYLKGPQTDNSELRILKAQADKFYNSFTKEDIKKYNILMPPPVPAHNRNMVVQKPIMWILVNRKGQLLVDDEVATLNDIEEKLKDRSKTKKANDRVYIKYDPEAPKQTITKLQSLVKKYNFEVFTIDATQIPPPPPPAKKSKGGPNTNDSQYYPIPPPIPENATPNEREKMQAAIDEFERKYKRKVHSAKMIETGELISLIANDEVYEPTDSQQKATKKQVAEYNVWGKKMNAAIKKAEATNNKIKEYPIIKKKEYDKYYKIYNKLMSEAQRKNAEPWPNIPPFLPPPPPEPPIATKNDGEIPPPPPPPTKAPQYTYGKKKTLNEIIKETPKDVESGYEPLENGETHYFTVYKGKKTYYNRNGYITDNKGNVLPPPPPPPPEPTLDLVIRMAKANAKFFYKEQSISSDEAIALIKKNDQLNISARQTDSEQPLVYISKKTILHTNQGNMSKQNSVAQKNILPIVNGIALKSGRISMRLNEIKKLIVTLPKGKITAFKFKIPGSKTEYIEGNTLTNTSLENLKTVKTGDVILIFDIKDGNATKFSPVAIEIVK